MPAPKAQIRTYTQPQIHPISGLRISPVRIISGDKTQIFHAELAQTGPDQERGLMFRTHLGADEAMLFPFNEPRPAAFWMKNTLITLDMIFIARDHTIANIAAKTRPLDHFTHPSQGPVIAVLEVPGGAAQAFGIAVGDKVEW